LQYIFIKLFISNIPKRLLIRILYKLLF